MLLFFFTGQTFYWHFDDLTNASCKIAFHDMPTPWWLTTFLSTSLARSHPTNQPTNTADTSTKKWAPVRRSRLPHHTSSPWPPITSTRTYLARRPPLLNSTHLGVDIARYACVCVYVCVWMYVCMYVCMWVCEGVCVCGYMYWLWEGPIAAKLGWKGKHSVCLYVCMFVSVQWDRVEPVCPGDR